MNLELDDGQLVTISFDLKSSPWYYPAYHSIHCFVCSGFQVCVCSLLHAEEKESLESK